MLQGRFSRQLLCAAIATLSSSYAASQAEGGPEIETLQVWGTQVKSSSVFMDQETMAIKQADHLSDLLRVIPGVDVGGAHSLNQKITIRGLDDRDLSIYIDGASQNSYMYHHMGNLAIHADILKSVDIEVGNNSVVDAGLGGSVRFETKDAEDLLQPGDQFGARVQVNASDNGSDSWSLSAFGQLTDSVDALVYYNEVERNNYEVGGGKIKLPNGSELLSGAGVSTDGEVRGLKGDLEDVLVKVGWDITDNQRLQLSYESYEDEGNYSYRPDMGLATDLVIAEQRNQPLVYPTKFTRDTLTLNYALRFGENSTLDATLYDTETAMWRNQTGAQGVVSGSGELRHAIAEGEANTKGLNILATTVFDGNVKHEWVYGLDYRRYETGYNLFSNNDPSSNADSGEEQKTLAVFFEDRISFEKWTFIPGIRYEQSTLEAAILGGSSENFKSETFEDFVFGFTTEYAPTSPVLIRASVKGLFKAPEISEVFVGAGLRDKANDDIDAETGVNAELAIGYEDSVLGADKFSFGVTHYNTEIKNYIYDYVRLPAPARGYIRENIGDMKLDGFEAYVGYDIGNFQSLVTFQSNESDLNASEAYPQYENSKIDRTQGDTFSLILDYSIPEYNLTLHWDSMFVDGVAARDRVLDSATLENSKDRYDVHNLSLRWLPEGELQGLEVTFGVDNVFDEYYASHSSRTGTSFHPFFGELYLLDYEPGRNFKATVSYQF